MVEFPALRKSRSSRARVWSPRLRQPRIRARPLFPAAGLRALLTAGAALLAAGLACGAEADRPEEVVEMVIQAMAHNYEQIKTADVTIEVVSEEDPSTLPAYLLQPDPKPKAQKSSAVTTFSGPYRRTQHVIIRGEDLRYEAQGDGGYSATTVFKNGVVSDYVASTKQLAIRRPDSLTVPAMDPREVGAVFASVPLADLLRSSELLAAELIDRGDSTTVAHVVLKYGPGRIEYEFDSSVGFLPTAKLGFGGDGYLKSWLRVTYQQVLDGKAWFLKEAVRLSYPPRAMKTPSEMGWYQRWRQTVTALRINQPVDDSVFAIDVPDGTVIADRVNKTFSVQGQDSPGSRSSSPRFVWYGAGIGVTLLLTVLGVLIYLRSH